MHPRNLITADCTLKLSTIALTKTPYKSTPESKKWDYKNVGLVPSSLGKEFALFTAETATHLLTIEWPRSREPENALLSCLLHTCSLLLIRSMQMAAFQVHL